MAGRGQCCAHLFAPDCRIGRPTAGLGFDRTARVDGLRTRWVDERARGGGIIWAVGRFEMTRTGAGSRRCTRREGGLSIFRNEIGENRPFLGIRVEEARCRGRSRRFSSSSNSTVLSFAGRSHSSGSARATSPMSSKRYSGARIRGLAFDPGLSINPETAVRGWLFGICERQARSHRRAEVKRGRCSSPTRSWTSRRAPCPPWKIDRPGAKGAVAAAPRVPGASPARGRHRVRAGGNPDGGCGRRALHPREHRLEPAAPWLRDLRAAWKRMSRKEGQEG